jgi:hypothetical protein
MEKMKITILCDQTNCVFNTDGWVKSNQMKHTGQSIHDYYCTNPQPVFVPQSDKSICASHTTKKQQEYLDKIKK